MSTLSKSEKLEVALSKGNTPRESLNDGIENLGGISKFIEKDDQVFIKFNLTLPGGFPLNTNLDVLKELILLCKEAGAKRIYLGSFPVKGISIKYISDLLDLKEIFSSFGAELVFFDNSNYYEDKKIELDQLKKIKYQSLTKVQIRENEFMIPNEILNSNKFISVNQINVNPIFKLNLSLLNIYSITPSKYRKINTNKHNINDYLYNDQYKQELITKILDVYAIKKPDLVINDLFYVLEGAGPYIYKESELRKTGFMVIGRDAIAVDRITMNLVNLEEDECILIKNAKKRYSLDQNPLDIKIIGEDLEDSKININQCISSIQDLKVHNIDIKSGKYCSGCFLKAYHLLNIMKTYMVKDLKYNFDNHFLIGDKPPEPEISGNTFIFGDCAVNSTRAYKFRKIIKESKKKSLGEIKNKIIKDKSKREKKTKIKEKENKYILEVSGCPPNIFSSLDLILKYYGYKNAPNLHFFTETNESWIKGKSSENLKIWEGL
ncbi:MAG: DUF362 domain-containing protein [Promethearchaeota archaeon]